MKFPRASGLLLHPTSLASEYGIGDLGPEARGFVDLLKKTGQTYWQILPLGPTGYGESPYQCFSAFAGNTLLLSPDDMIADGLLTKEDISDKPTFPAERVDFEAVQKYKAKLLSLAYARFKKENYIELANEFESFENENAWWLNDYAAFRSIKQSQGKRAWYDWPEPLKLREPGAMGAIGSQLGDMIDAEKFFQFLFFRQWKQLKEYANNKGVKVIGDLPIFVALDSADVWCNRQKFKLNADGTPKVVAGVPPDYFSSTGQLWGNPIYDWDKMGAEGFQWWVARMAFTLRMFDIVRLDHFRGFYSTWEVPSKDETAEHGKWVSVPGKELFSAMIHDLGELPVIAEDLGDITPEVLQLRDHFGFPGMKILQFAFGGDARNQDLPHNYVGNSVVYTGTHDNDTTIGWWLSRAGKKFSQEREFCLRYLNSRGNEMNWDMMRTGWASVSNTAIAPVQDILGLGTEARMNLPATTSGNWLWRMKPGAVTPKIAERLKELSETYDRIPDRPTE